MISYQHNMHYYIMAASYRRELLGWWGGRWEGRDKGQRQTIKHFQGGKPGENTRRAREGMTDEGIEWASRRKGVEKERGRRLKTDLIIFLLICSGHQINMQNQITEVMMREASGIRQESGISFSFSTFNQKSHGYHTCSPQKGPQIF